MKAVTFTELRAGLKREATGFYFLSDPVGAADAGPSGHQLWCDCVDRDTWYASLNEPWRRMHATARRRSKKKALDALADIVRGNKHLFGLAPDRGNQ